MQAAQTIDTGKGVLTIVGSADHLIVWDLLAWCTEQIDGLWTGADLMSMFYRTTGWAPQFAIDARRAELIAELRQTRIVHDRLLACLTNLDVDFGTYKARYDRRK